MKLYTSSDSYVEAVPKLGKDFLRSIFYNRVIIIYLCFYSNSYLKDTEYDYYRNYAGSVSTDFIQSVAANDSYYVLLNNEFPTSGYLVGFWIYSSKPGNIQIMVFKTIYKILP